MTARAPQAIWNLWYAIHRGVPRSLLGGIVGDVGHSFGYHLARRDLPSSDYSVQLPKDKLGKADCASAIDISLPPDLMLVYTRKLVVAAKAKDPRLAAVREFCGTTNGLNPHPFDLSRNADDPSNTQGWDDSHLSHIHISFYREYADHDSALLPVAELFTDEEDPLAGLTLDQIAAAVWAQKLSDGTTAQPASSYLKQTWKRSDPAVLAAKLAKLLPDVPEERIVAALREVFADAGSKG